MNWHRHAGRNGGRQVRVNHAGELCYLTFPIFENISYVNHLFTTRLGGVSEGIYASLNLSYARGDKKEAVDENYRRVAAALGCSVEQMVCSDQTHTTNLRVVGRADGGKGITRSKDYREVDGLLTDEPGVFLATFYADCVPLYFVDTRRKAIALAHSGWRGTLARMGRHVVEKMREAYGTDPADLLAVVGPSICQEGYEVGDEVAGAFAAEFRKPGQEAEILQDKGGGKYQLDLWRANEILLLEAGIPEGQIQVTDICTYHNDCYLFSHRKSEGRRGNLGAFLGIAGAL